MKKSKTLFMETTKIDPEQTVGQIQGLLGRYGASGIQIMYEKMEISAVTFAVEVDGRNIHFVLPCRWTAVHTVIVNRMRKVRESRKDEYVLQSKRVAWRQILRWVEAQLAMVETDMVRLEEVFMPYLVVGKGGLTLFDKMSNDKFLLEAPKKP